MQIIITISPSGQSHVEAHGITGNTCQKLTADIERALGKTTRDQKKPDFFHASEIQQEIRR